jgi:hypothetical protein
MTDEEIIAEANAFARDFYRATGSARAIASIVPRIRGIRFCWQMVAVPFERLRRADIAGTPGE